MFNQFLDLVLHKAGVVPSGVPSVHNLIPQWWENIRTSPAWDHGAFIGLAVSYTAIAMFAAVQLYRVERRVPEFGWTTQKVFHLLNLLVCVMRAAVMFFRYNLKGLHAVVLKALLFDVPGLLFFTTYTLLVLFWAEIYHQARNTTVALAHLRPLFLAANVVVYIVQITLLFLTGSPATPVKHTATVASSWFLAIVSLAAAAGFLSYGGRLFFMLRSFPIASIGRLRKLREVGFVTAVCTLCFVLRAIMISIAALDPDDFKLDVTSHPLLNIAYYALAEIVPSALVLIILRKLPPRRRQIGQASQASQPQLQEQP